MSSVVTARDSPEFREGAVRIVIETGRPIPEGVEELGVHSGTLHSRVSRWRRNGSASSDRRAYPAPPGGRIREAERAELERLRREMLEKRTSGYYFKSRRLHADKAYDIPHLRKWLWGKHIGVRIARKGIDSSE